MPLIPHRWHLLIPAAALAHMAEEYWIGFPAWSSQHLGFHLTMERFLVLNGVALVVIVVASIAAAGLERGEWSLTAVTFALCLNGIAHLVMSMVTRSYSPGVITGVLLFVPLGIVVLPRAYRHLGAARFAGAATLGAIGHILVTLAARSA